MDLFDPTIVRVISFVDGSATSHQESIKAHHTFVSPAIPPPELIIGEDGRYRAVLVIADGARFPVYDELDDSAEWRRQLPPGVTHEPLYETLDDDGLPRRLRMRIGYARTRRFSASDQQERSPMALVAVRALMQQPATLAARIAIGMAKINQVVGDAAPIVVYIMPGPDNGINWGRELLAQVACNAHRFGRRGISVIVAPGADVPAVALTTDATGTFTPNAPGFQGLLPGQRLLTVLTQRRKRPCWLVCKPVDRLQLHRYLELPPDLVLGSDTTPPSYALATDCAGGRQHTFGAGYGRRVTDATVRRMVLLQRLGALQDADELPSTSVMYSDDEMTVTGEKQDAASSKQALLRIFTDSVLSAYSRTAAEIEGNILAQKRLLFDQSVKLMMQNDAREAASVLGLLEQDYTTLTMFDDAPDAVGDRYEQMGLHTRPYLEAKKQREAAVAMQDELVELTKGVLSTDRFRATRKALLETSTAAAMYCAHVFALDSNSSDEYVAHTKEVVKRIGELLTRADDWVGQEGLYLQPEPQFTEHVKHIEAELTEIERAVGIDADVTYPLSEYSNNDECNSAFLEIMNTVASEVAQTIRDGLGLVAKINHRMSVCFGSPTQCPDKRLFVGRSVDDADHIFYDQKISDLAVDCIAKIGMMLDAVDRCLDAYGRTYNRLNDVVAALVDKERQFRLQMQVSATAVVKKAEDWVLKAPPNVSPAAVRRLAAIRAVSASTVAVIEEAGNKQDLAVAGPDGEYEGATSSAGDKPAFLTKIDGLIDPGNVFLGLGGLASVLAAKELQRACKEGQADGRAIALAFWNSDMPTQKSQLVEHVETFVSSGIDTNASGDDLTDADKRFLRISFVLSVRETHRWIASFKQDMQQLLAERVDMQAWMLDRLVTGFDDRGQLLAVPKSFLPLTLLGDVLSVARRKSWFSWLDRVLARAHYTVGLPRVNWVRWSAPSYVPRASPGVGFRSKFNMPGRLGGRTNWAAWFQMPAWLHYLLYGETPSRWTWGRFGGLCRVVLGFVFGGRRQTEAPASGLPGRIGGARPPAAKGFMKNLRRATNKRAKPSTDLLQALQDLQSRIDANDKRLNSLLNNRPRTRRGGRRNARGKADQRSQGAPPRPRPVRQKDLGTNGDLVVPLNALRLVVGPVLEGKPDSPLLFGPPLFPLLVDLGRFSRVVLLTRAIPCVDSIPAQMPVSWIEACLARGGDVRLCLGGPGPRYAVSGALGGTAILEERIGASPGQIAMRLLDHITHEDGCIVVVPGLTNAVVSGGTARTADSQMLVVCTPEQLLPAQQQTRQALSAAGTGKARRKPRFAALVAAKRQR